MKKHSLLILFFVSCLFLLTAFTEKTWVEDQEITLNFVFGEITGIYTGEIEKGIPNGTGTFTTQNFDEKPWYYEGEFKGGHFDGEGKTVFLESGQTMEGTYENDIWHPNAVQFYDFIQTLEESDFVMTEQTRLFIKQRPFLFPTHHIFNVKGYINKNLEYENIIQTELLNNQLIFLPHLSIENTFDFTITENPEDLDNLNCTFFAASDKFGNRYDIYYRGRMEKIPKGDFLSVYGLPIGTEKTNHSIVIAASLLELE